MNSPLTKQERIEIERLLKLDQRSSHRICDAALEAAMRAERFWREAVRDADFGGPIFNINAICFCGSLVHVDKHRPDCAWLLAQGDE